MSFTPSGVEFIAKGLNQYLGDLGKADKAQQGLGKSVANLAGPFDNIGKSMLSMGAIAGGAALAGITALGAAVTGFAVGGIGKAVELDQQLANIAATAGKTKEQMGGLKDLIFDLSLNPNLVVNVTQAADAIQVLLQNGATLTDEFGNVTKAGENLATQVVALSNSTGATFPTAASIATDAANLFKLENEDLAKAVDGATGVMVASKFGAEDYGQALAQAGGVAGGMGVSIEDFNTVIAATATQFTSGSDAGTSFKTMLQRLANPTDEMQALMKQYGISLFDADGKMKNMRDVADQLNKVLFGTVSVTEQVGGATKQQAAAAATAQKNMAGLAADISTNEKQLQLYNDQLALEIGYYGEGSPKVRQRQIQIDKLTNTINDQKGKMGEYEAALAAVDGAQVRNISSTKQLTEAERAELAAKLGGADAARTLLGLAQLTGEEYDKLSGSVNEQGQALRAAATRVDSLSGAWDIFKGVVEAIQIQVGDKFLPILRKVTVWFTDMATKFGPKVIDAFGVISKRIEKLMGAFGRFGVRGGAISILGMLGLEPDQIGKIMATIDSVVIGVTETVTKISDAFSKFGARGAAVSIMGLLGLQPDTIATVLSVTDQIIAAISDFVAQVGSFLGSLSFEEITGAILGIGAVLAGGVLVALGVALFSLLTPVNLLIAGAALLGAAWAGNWGDIQGVTMAAWAAIEPSLMALWGWLQTNLPLAVQFLADVWTGTLQPALIQVGAFIVGTVIPAMVNLWTWLQTNLPIAVQFLADAWNTVLLPALTLVWSFISGTLFPIWLQLQVFLVDVIGAAISNLSNQWTNVLLPALAAVGSFISGSIFPLLVSIGRLINAVVNKAVQAMAGLWQNVLQPALQSVWKSLQDNLLPVFNQISKVIQDKFMPPTKTLTNDILPSLKTAFDGIIKAIKEAVGWFNSLASAVDGFSLPPILTPGSPTPFENAIVGIANALGGATRAFGDFEGAFSRANYDKLFGIDRRMDAVKNVLRAALSDTKSSFNSFIADSKVHAARKALEKIFMGSARSILAATDRVEAFREAIKASGFDFGAIGFSGTWAGTIDSAAQDIIHAFEKQQVKFAAAMQATLLKGARGAVGLGQKLNDVVQASAEMFDERIQILRDLFVAGGGEFEGKTLTQLEAQQALNAALEEQAGIQNELNILQRNESQLKFLEKQLDLIETVKKAGLDIGKVLGGLNLGVNASIPDMIEATNRLVTALIGQAGQDLGSLGFQAGAFGRVPGYGRGDSFGPIFLEPGEEILVTPRGHSIEGELFDRLGQMMGGRGDKNTTINMPIYTSEQPQSIIRQARVAQALIG